MSENTDRSERMTGTPSKDRAGACVVPDYIADAITEAYGERCEDFAAGCHCCEAWSQYDDLVSLRAQADEAETATRNAFAEGMKRATDALDKYRASLADIPLGHENPQRGASTYNWKVAVFEEIRDAILAEIGER